jgi:hypothetical protein
MGPPSQSECDALGLVLDVLADSTQLFFPCSGVTALAHYLLYSRPPMPKVEGDSSTVPFAHKPLRPRRLIIVSNLPSDSTEV